MVRYRSTFPEKHVPGGSSIRDPLRSQRLVHLLMTGGLRLERCGEHGNTCHAPARSITPARGLKEVTPSSFASFLSPHSSSLPEFDSPRSCPSRLRHHSSSTITLEDLFDHLAKFLSINMAAFMQSTQDSITGMHRSLLCGSLNETVEGVNRCA